MNRDKASLLDITQAAKKVLQFSQGIDKNRFYRTYHVKLLEIIRLNPEGLSYKDKTHLRGFNLASEGRLRSYSIRL